MAKPKVLFVYDQRDPLWNDGCKRGMEIIADDFDIHWHNILEAKNEDALAADYDFYLGRGNWDGAVEVMMRSFPGPKGMLLCGNVCPPHTADQYTVLFYESEVQKAQLQGHPMLIHAFGINTEVNRPLDMPKIFDYLTIGAFSYWKRQHMMLNKTGVRLAVGEIQKENMVESMDIISQLMRDGVGIMDQVSPETLNLLYNASKVVYIPADIDGGGERAVLEARAAGVPVEVEDDNPKLKWLLDTPIWDQHYYAKQIRNGIESCL